MSVDLEELKRRSWSKANIVDGADPDVIRKDDYGYWIRYDQFLTEDKLAWDLEKRKDVFHPDPEFYPVSRIRMKRIYQEVERVIEEKIRKRGSK